MCWVAADSGARLAALAGASGPRVFVVDTSRTLYGGWPDAATLAWLEGHTREITAGIPGAHGRPLRVFVRP